MKLHTRAAAALLLVCALPAAAKVPAAQAARLGLELTPIGAEQAGNAEGSLPSWTPAPRRGALDGEYPSNPSFDAEKPLFTITKANMARHAARLTEGHKKLLSSYDSYRMPVYPSHRVVSWPEFITRNSRDNAELCELRDVDTPSGCKTGFPFPIPRSGAEVVWNHKVRYRGHQVRRYNNQMIVQRDGRYQLTKILEEAKFYFGNPDEGVSFQGDNGLILKYLSRTTAPPRLAGTFVLLHERAGSGTEGRAAWLYSPALKRVRRAPSVCCDNPYEGTDGHQFYDQVDMFNGVLDRYDWKLVGKKEVYIPYDSNRIASPALKYARLATPLHVDPSLTRYELHRVWVVEANLRPRASHTFARRRFYVDEDSWYIVAADLYDNRGELYQFQEAHTVFAYNVQTVGGMPEVIYHFDSGRYFVTALANEDRPNDFAARFDEAHFETGTVRKISLK